MTQSPFWCLVYTRTQCEERAHGHLEQQGFEVFLPRIRKTVRHAGCRRERIEPMFPRYLFVHLDPTVEDWSPIRSTVGVTTLVRFGREPGIVPAEIVDGLRGRADEHGIIGCDAPGDFEPGQNVRIVEGPFEGYQAIVHANLARERVDILLAMVGQYVTARVRAVDLAPQ